MRFEGAALSLRFVDSDKKNMGFTLASKRYVSLPASFFFTFTYDTIASFASLRNRTGRILFRESKKDSASKVITVYKSN